MKVTWPTWSSTKVSGPGCASSRRMVVSMFGACSPTTHDVRAIVAPMPAAAASCSPASFDAP